MKLYYFVLALLPFLVNAQSLEGFNYTGSLSSNGWTKHSGTEFQFATISTTSDFANSLSYNGLQLGTGNRAVFVSGNSEDVNKAVSPGTTGYYSLLIKVPSTQGISAAGDYFIGFGSTSGASVTNFGGRLYIKPGSTPNTVLFGLMNNAGGGGTPSYTGTEYAVGQTHLLVVKLNISTTPIQSALWVDPTVGNPEPTATLLNTSSTSSFSAINSVFLRQGNTGSFEFDEIRVGSTYESVTPFTCENTSKINPIKCESYTVPSGDETYTTSGVYMDTLLNANLCDSILTINLTINSKAFSTIDVEACNSYTVPSGDETYTTSGNYLDTITTTQGCDSVLMINLTITTTIYKTITAKACNSYTVPSGDETYTTSGMYSDTLQSSQGCDSVLTINLTIHYDKTSSISMTACATYTVPSGDETYTVSGIYLDTIPTVEGCDSVITIDLTILNPTSSNMSLSACDSVIVNNTVYYFSGEYIQKLSNSNNCDSTIYITVELKSTPLGPILEDTTICFGASNPNLTAKIPMDAKLLITGVLDGPLPGGLPKVVEFYALDDIQDLSLYGFGVATNGGGSSGIGYTFPNDAISKGTHFTLTSSPYYFQKYFGFDPEYVDSSLVTGTSLNINGDDAIELFFNNNVIDVFGEINADGTGAVWEYLDGWAYRRSNALPNLGLWNSREWIYSGINVLDGETSNLTAVSKFPLKAFEFIQNYTWYSDANLTNVVSQTESYTPIATSAGTYTYYVVNTNGTCSSETKEVDFTISNALSASIIATPELQGNDGTLNLTVTGGTLPYKFDWSNGSTSEDLSNLTQGTYTVQITDANGCQFTLSGIVEDQVGLTDISKPSFKVYPNPSVNGIFTIESEIAGKSEMMIKNVQGMIVFIVQLEGGQTKVDLSNLTPGMYIGSIHSMGQHFEIKLIK